MKSYLRKSKASGSTVAKIDRLIRRGWEPGKALGPQSRKAASK